MAEAPVAVDRWSGEDLHLLAEAISGAAAEGLDPDLYRLPGLIDAVRSGRGGPTVDELADRAALMLAHDYVAGRVADRAAFDWHIASPEPDPARLAAELAAARQSGQLLRWLHGLLPSSPAYRALRAALQTTAPQDIARRDRIRANMERWRWMPRDFGSGTYLYVNVPSYTVRVVSDGVDEASYVAVVGARDTPTPALAAAAKAVVVNPWWYVPRSLIDKGEVRSNARAASRGFVFRTGSDGRLVARQKPGPTNSLGRIKIEMPNAHAIYLHDTPARALFARADRARSHGCIRVQDIDDLAARLVSDGGDVHEALAETDTRTLRLERSWPVFLVYFTMDRDANGALRDLPDIYDRDGALVALLHGRAPVRAAVELAAAANEKKLAQAPRHQPAAEPHAPAPPQEVEAAPGVEIVSTEPSSSEIDTEEVDAGR